MRREIAPSRIACTAFSQAKWYINTPEKSNKTLPGDERRENRSFFHMTNLWTTITKTTITRVDSYMRHENPLGRFLREATGGMNPFSAGNLSNGHFATKCFEYNSDLFFSVEDSSCLSLDIPNDRLGCVPRWCHW